jgi:soluble P-type ATPase
LIQIEIPGWSTCELGHLVLSPECILGANGEPVASIDGRLTALSAHLSVHLVMVDGQGLPEAVGQRLGGQLIRTEPRYEASEKQALVERLGAGQVVAIGNGASDARMLRAAALGIAILGRQGVAVQTLRAADLVVNCIDDALDLLLDSQRLVATLRR